MNTYGFRITALALPLLAVAATSPLVAQVNWTGGSTPDLNWSSAGNWSALPTGQDVFFTNAGAVTGTATVTSIVDENYSIGSLSFAHFDPVVGNASSYQNIQIATDKTLTINGGLTVGTATESALASNSEKRNGLIFGGTGSLAINGGGTNNVTVLPINDGTKQLRYRRMAILNLQTLSNFSATNLNSFVLGADQNGGPTYTSSSAILAQTNTIQAASLVLQGFGGKSIMQLGTTNTLHVDDILIGHQDLTAPDQTWNGGTAELNFRTGLTGATVQIRAADGVSAANILVGRSGTTATTSSGQGILNLSGGTTDAKIENLVIGLADQGARTAAGSVVDGTVTLGAGLVEAENIVVGRTTDGNTTAIAGVTANATLTLNNAAGTLDVANDLVIGDAQQSHIGLTSTVNLESGTLKAATIRAGANAAGNRAANFNWQQNSVIRNHAGTDLVIEEGITFTMQGAGAHTFNIDAGRTGTVKSAILGTGDLVKDGEGTLVIESTGNTYTGDTLVSAGRLVVLGDLSNSSVTLQSDSTLLLTDTTFISLTWNEGAKIEADLNGLTTGLFLTGSFAIGSDGLYIFDFLNTGSAGETYTLISGFSANSLTADLFGYENLAGGLTGSFAFDGNALTFTVVPEPAHAALLLLSGVSAIAFLRRRRANRVANSNK